MINANIYNVTGVILCILPCIVVLRYIFKEYEFTLEESDED